MNHTQRKMLLRLAMISLGLVIGRFLHGEEPRETKAPAVLIGKRIFLDATLSRPVGQGCFSCHRIETAFADSRPVSPGAVKGRFGRRNSPSLMYAALIPGFAYEDLPTDDGTEIYAWEGGLFHDGRAGDLFEQVQQPFFDPNEMNLPDEQALASRLRESTYAAEFRQWVGEEAWKDDQRLNYHAFRALVEFLKEPMFRPFDARIDDYLKGKASLTPSELRGLDVFRGDGKCADCHLLDPTSWTGPLLSDYGYDNLGVPSRQKKDAGLGGQTGEPSELGQFRAPSLRNVVLTPPYMHNGSIQTLKEVLEFYNRRDIEPQRWGHTDYPDTVNRQDMGDLKLSDQQVSDLLALMSAFTDRSLLNCKDGEVFPAATAETPPTEEVRLYFPDWTHRKHPSYPGICDPPSPVLRPAAGLR
ncbi:MAG: cytochrome c peroxidase [Rubripirellula sp.]|nr:cytochrome c peroxidase [Rubripirellula sp.]